MFERLKRLYNEGFLDEAATGTAKGTEIFQRAERKVHGLPKKFKRNRSIRCPWLIAA